MAGKAPESAGLKAVVEAFNQLSPEEQTLFRSKVFAKLCTGLSKEQRAAFKKERVEFLARLEQEKKKAAQRGKTLTEETKQKLRIAYQKYAYKMKEIVSRSTKGRIWVTNGIINKRVYPTEIPEGFFKGRIETKKV